MTIKDYKRILRPRFPVKQRVIEATFKLLSYQTVNELADKDIIWWAKVTQDDFTRAFSTRTALLQATSQYLYDLTMKRNTQWALDDTKALTVRERFEAYLKSLNLADDPAFYASLNNIVVAEAIIWPDTDTPAFNQRYFTDCWTNALYVLYKDIMADNKAQSLAVSTGHRLQQAALKSGYHLRHMIKSLRYAFPTIYHLALDEPELVGST